MNRKRFIMAAISALAFVSLAAGVTYFAIGQYALDRPRSVNELASRQWAREVGLTGDQQKRLAPLEQNLKKDLKDVQTQLANERMALCGILHSGSNDTLQLDQYVRKIAELEGQQQKLVVSHLVAMRDVLTPHQRDRFFNAVMKGICENCRMATHENKCLCGMCNLKKV